MYVPDTLNRLNEEVALQACSELVNDDGSPIVCDFCSEDAVIGIPVYNPADSLRRPPVNGVYCITYLCQDCCDNGYGMDDTFYCDGCDKQYIIKHSWDVLAVKTDCGWSCQKCASENLLGVQLGYVLADLRNGETNLFTRINSVPGKECFFDGEFALCSDFPGYNDWEVLAEAIKQASKEYNITASDIVYPIVDHGYQFSVSLAIYH